MKRRLLIIGVFALAIGMAVAGFALATPGAGAVPVELGRETMPKFSANFTNRDIVVGEFNFAPGGFSGWHSHPGKVIVAVARGSITLYRGTDPACAGTTYEAGDLVYHLLVMLAYCDVRLSDLESELARRFGISGLEEKAAREDGTTDALG